MRDPHLPKIVPKKLIPPAVAISDAQSELLNKVAQDLADFNDLIIVALFASDDGPFARWLQAKKDYKAEVEKFHAEFHHLIDTEKFRFTALLRRQNSKDPRPKESLNSARAVAEATSSALEGDSSDSSELNKVRSKDWELLSSADRKAKWMKFLQTPSAAGGLRYQKAIDFLSKNIARLTPVRAAWEATLAASKPSKSEPLPPISSLDSLESSLPEAWKEWTLDSQEAVVSASEGLHTATRTTAEAELAGTKRVRGAGSKRDEFCTPALERTLSGLPAGSLFAATERPADKPQSFHPAVSSKPDEETAAPRAKRGRRA